ncbi:MAG: glycoside hydrolase family 9 protein [Cytophagales bacterium]|nr:glycoside hydrolase family 9 protein [Cytophagales bacterium]
MKINKIILFSSIILYIGWPAIAQKNVFYTNENKIVTSQLGFIPDSPKLISLVPAKDKMQEMPDVIPFYIQKIGNRKKRKTPDKPTVWTDKIYRWPFDIDKGNYLSTGEQYHKTQGEVQYEGNLIKKISQWGTFWQSNFTSFTTPGLYQIETEYGFTSPFIISNNPYQRLQRSFLIYLQSQRSGSEVPGVRYAENADDAVAENTNYAMPLSGGWNDAGDTRKWLSQTLPNMEALAHIAKYSDPYFAQQAISEIQWGNKYFYFMISDSGFVYEDVGAGYVRPGLSYDKDWWIENHAGCVATGAKEGDNIPMNGNDRTARPQYNPLIQYLFVRNQALVAEVLPVYDRNKSLILAARAWKYAQKRGNDGRTLFVAQSLLAACELYKQGVADIDAALIKSMVKTLINRQKNSAKGIGGYFMEADGTTPYRSIVYSAEPAIALLRFCELDIKGTEKEKNEAEAAVRKYASDYLIKDAKSNPFFVTPYGAYSQKPQNNSTQMRPIPNGDYMRTFIDPHNEQEMVHGTSATVNQHAYLLARAYKYFGDTSYKNQACKLIMWDLGHNPYELCLATGVGFKHPVPASYYNYKIPDAHVVGFAGRPDDTPYIETSNAIEWNTQEVWGVPYAYLICATVWLVR